MPTAEEIIEQAQAAYEAKRLAKGGGAKGSESRKALDALQGDVPAGGKADAGALGSGLLGALDTATLGAVPALDDWLREKGIIDAKTAPPSVREQLAAGAEHHPYASFAGRAGGMMLPFTAAAKAAQAGLGAGKLAAGAIGAGGANVADQAVRAQTEDREFSVPEAALATATGGLGPLAFHPIKALGGAATRGITNRVLGKTAAELTEQLPNVADDAARTAASALDDAAAARAAAGPGRSTTGGMERPPRPQPAPEAPPTGTAEPLGGYAADDPLAEIARMARESARQRRVSDPNWTPDIGPVGPPPAPPFAGVRPSKLEPGSPMAEQLGGRIRGEPPPPMPPAAPPPPPPAMPAPPGMLDVPLGKLAVSSGLTAGEQTRKNAIEENKRRRKKGAGAR